MSLEWSTACPDWADRIIARKSLIPNVVFDEQRAAKGLRNFKRLRMVDVIGQPRMGDACEEWVFDFVRAIFGAVDPATKRQLIRDFFLLVAKKNGKSSIAAGIMITALTLNERAQGEYLILAPTKEVADNSFTPAYGMVKADEALFKRYKPSDSTREIIDRLDGSCLIVKAADADTVGGGKSVAIFVDELWLFGKKASAENILSEATGSLASRPEGFVIFASTQSNDRPAGVFKKKLQYFRKVRDGEIVDRASLPLIYEYPPAMQKAKAWEDRSTWYIPNPGLGRSVDPEWLGQKLTEKTHEGVDSVRLFVAKHFNVEVGIGLHTDRWAGADHWEAAGVEGLNSLDELIERSEVVVVGGDGGGLDDLLGLGVMGREKETRRWLFWAHAWAHRSVLDLRQEIAPRLLDFAEAGELTIVDMPGQDVTDFADIVEKVWQSGLMPEKNGIGVDPVGIAQIVDELHERGIPKEGVVGISQGWKLSGAIKTAERGLADKSFVHGSQPMMAWAIGNAKVEPRGNAITITKQTAGTAKIDPLMAMLDCVALMSMNPEPRISRYETAGLRSV